MIKRVSILCITIIVLCALNFVSMASEVPSSWAQKEVDQAIKLGYVPEFLQSNYRNPITREEFATLFVTAIFSDINDTNSRKPEYMKEAWHFRELNVDNFISKVKSNQVFEDTTNKYVKVANMLGIINGNSASTFNPDGKITREQVAIMIANHVQTLTAPLWAQIEEVEDYNNVSEWARNGVIFTYEAILMNGTRKAVYDERGTRQQTAIFSPKDLLTREQAIMIIHRLGRNDKDFLEHINFRGYVRGNMDILMSGVEIEGDKVTYKASNYNNRYTDFNLFLESMEGRYGSYVSKYTSEKLSSIFFSPSGPDLHMLEENHISKVLDGEYIKYNYGSYTVEYNKDGYLTTVNRDDKKGLFAFGAYLMYGDLSSESGVKPVKWIPNQ